MTQRREVLRSLAKLEYCAQVTWDKKLTEVVSFEDPATLVTNFTSFARKVVIQNCHPAWRWNKSLQVEGLESVLGQCISMQKFSSRTFSSTYKCPQYKIWVSSWLPKTGEAKIHFIWCEKGDALCISDLEFLIPFLSPRTAADIWKPHFKNE